MSEPQKQGKPAAENPPAGTENTGNRQNPPQKQRWEFSNRAILALAILTGAAILFFAFLYVRSFY